MLIDFFKKLNKECLIWQNVWQLHTPQSMHYAVPFWLTNKERYIKQDMTGSKVVCGLPSKCVAEPSSWPSIWLFLEEFIKSILYTPNVISCLAHIRFQLGNYYYTHCFVIHIVLLPYLCFNAERARTGLGMRKEYFSVRPCLQAGGATLVLGSP